MCAPIGHARLDAMTTRSHGASRLRFWRPIPRDAADVICGEGTVDELPIHAHEALQVMLPASRFSVVDATGGDVIVRQGQLHVAAPLELHGARAIDGVECAMRVVLIPLAALPSSSPCWEGAAPGRRQFVADDAVLYAELWTLIDELRGPLVGLSSVTHLLRCVARLLADLAPPPPPPCAPAPRARRQIDGIDRVGAHLRAHVGANVSLDELAAVAGLSKFYLLRAFRRAYGVTPHAYQRQLRLAHAWQTIANGYPLTRATYDAGFADQSHLTRQFAALFGLTPARCARQLVTPRAATVDTPATARSAPPSAA
jgi:AraC-like DNA-binding protein